jgi:tetratricopeptide (TPR) repeat protein
MSTHASLCHSNKGPDWRHCCTMADGNAANSSSDDNGPFLDTLAREFPTGEFENWATCQQLMPQANFAYKSVPITHKSWEAWAQISTNVAWYLWRTGDYKEAQEMVTEALAVRDKVLQPNDLRTLLSVEILAGVLMSQEIYDEAVASHRRALKGFKETLGSLHPFTLTSNSNLALTLQHLGYYKDSERLNRLVLRGSKMIMGSKHVDTLTSMSNLALALQHQGKYKRAKRLNQQSLDGFRETLGKQHPSTLTSMYNLAVVLQCQGRYEESEELYRQSLRGKVEELGWNHPSTLMGIDGLASVLQCQGQRAESEQLYRQYEK